MKKEIVLLERGKPVLQKDIAKIVEAMHSDKKVLPYMIYEFFQLCETKQKLEGSISILLKNVFENMRTEIVETIPETIEIEETPILIGDVSGYTVLLFEDKEDKGFIVNCPSLPGCGTEGNTEEEAIRNVKDAIKGYLECARKHGVTVRQ